MPEILDSFKANKVKYMSVEPLDETINFMKNNIYNFQPALEIIQEIYNRKLNTKYKESNYQV
ncbi:MAG: hypothetical protein AABW58_00815 [Nanoarchaeota archaeon]